MFTWKQDYLHYVAWRPGARGSELRLSEQGMAMRRLVGRFLRDRSGAAVVEYGLIAALVSVAAITALTKLRQRKTTLEAA